MPLERSHTRSPRSLTQVLCHLPLCAEVWATIALEAMCNDTAAQSAAAVSAEASMLWMRKCEQLLQATGTGSFGRIPSLAICSAFRRVLAQRQTDQGLVDSVRAVQRELQRHPGLFSADLDAPMALGAYLHTVRPPKLYPLASAVAQIVPPPVHLTAKTAGEDPVVQRLVQIVRSGASAAIQAAQLRDLQPMPHHHKVVCDFAEILSRTVYCRAQHQALLFLLRQLKPPTKGTPEFIAKQQKSKDVFQCALWAPSLQPQQARQSVAAKRPAGGTGQEGAPWGAPAQRQRTALSPQAASTAAAAAASAASHSVGGSTAPLPAAKRPKPSPQAPAPPEMSPADVDKKLGDGASTAGWTGMRYGASRTPNYFHYKYGRHNNAKDAKKARLQETGS